MLIVGLPIQSGDLWKIYLLLLAGVCFSPAIIHVRPPVDTSSQLSGFAVYGSSIG